MRLLAVGDSFTYGEELTDRSVSWPCLLADRLGYELTTLALPAKGNDYMVRKVIENADEYDLIVVAWSHFARLEFADEHGIYDIWPGNAGNLFTNELSYRKDILSYINRHHDDQYSYSRYLINIILLQNYFKQNNKKYIMLTSFNQNYIGDLAHVKFREKLSHLVDKVDQQYYIGWPDKTMMEWTYGTAKGPGGHFLEQGHRIVADNVYEHIRHLGWVS